MTASALLCGLEREALSVCMAHRASAQCSSCLAGSEFLLYPADGAGTSSCESLSDQICRNAASHWSSCLCDGYCEGELEDFYHCSLMANTADNLDCTTEDLFCFGASSAQTETRDVTVHHVNHHRQRKLNIFDFFTGLFNLIDVFNIIPDPAPPPTISPAPTQQPIVNTVPACFTELLAINSCLETAGQSANANDRSCSACLIQINLEGLLSDSVFDSSTSCSDTEAQTCSYVVNQWNQCSCQVCKVETSDYFACLIETYASAQSCSSNLCCWGEDCSNSCQAYNPDGTCARSNLCQAYNPDGTCAPPCFSPYNTIEVKDKGAISITDLQIGDLVSINEKGEYSRVYSLGHHDDKSRANYLQIFAEGFQQPLEISPNHLLYVNSKLTPASQVQKGDILNSNGISVKVIEIEPIQRQGIYAPLTESGTLRVSGVGVSNYVTLSTFLPRNVVPSSDYLPYSMHHAISHGWTAPLRWACALNFEICKSETYQKGYASWVYANLQFSSKVGETPKLVQIGLVLLVAPFPLAFNSQLFMMILVFFFFCIYCFNKTPIIIKTKSKSC